MRLTSIIFHCFLCNLADYTSLNNNGHYLTYKSMRTKILTLFKVSSYIKPYFSETAVASAVAEVMMYNENRKKWQSPDGCDGQLSNIQILHNGALQTFRIIAIRDDGVWVLNCKIHHKLKYHTATPTFHQWRDEQRQVVFFVFVYVYGLNFSAEKEARDFVSAVGQAIDFLSHQYVHGGEYQTIQLDNIMNIMVIHGVLYLSKTYYIHIFLNFRKSSHTVHSGQIPKQQRRASQGSSASLNGVGTMYSQARLYLKLGMFLNVISKVFFAEQLKNAQLKKTNIVKESRSLSVVDSSTSSVVSGSSATTNGTTSSHGDLLSELAATFSRKKITQAKADAVDSKSNISNGSSDSGCGTIPSVNGFPPNGVKKWEQAKSNGHTDSPKTHRKAPSGSSISSQEEGILKTNIPIPSSFTPITQEMLERFKADIMVEVRLEMNKMKEEIVEVLRTELARR
uniref:WH1 domain-containing protein n=1 Tax=Heterorhabditis bacteriophora TaxID=37862 RepID=A0A1I7WGS3_HETBA